MKKSILFFMGLFMGLASIFAQSFPTISTDENTKWYLIQFSNGGDVLTANTSGTQITIGSALGSDTQLWKITGDATDGYTFTNKKGYTLYVNSAATNQMVNAATSPSGVSKFFINETTHSIGGYEIQPKGNTNISMNLWGGPGDSRACVGLWNSGDQNNAVKFLDASAFENMSKITLIPYPQEITIGETTFDLTKLNAIAYNSDEMKSHAENFAAQLKKSSGIELTVKKAESAASEEKKPVRRSRKPKNAKEAENTEEEHIVRLGSAIVMDDMLPPAAFTEPKEEEEAPAPKNEEAPASKKEEAPLEYGYGGDGYNYRKIRFSFIFTIRRLWNTSIYYCTYN